MRPEIKALWEGSILKNLTRNLPWSEPTAKYTKETKITVAMSIINVGASSAIHIHLHRETIGQVAEGYKPGASLQKGPR